MPSCLQVESGGCGNDGCIMKTILLQKNLITKVDDDDYIHLINYKWYAVKSRSIKYKDAYYVYLCTSNKNIKKVAMHRAILKCEDGMVVDHIDGDGLNNQKSNLRIVTCRENLQSRHHPKTSAYPGVYLYRNKFWRAQIRISGKLKDLGCYKNEIDAYCAYQKACGEL